MASQTVIILGIGALRRSSLNIYWLILLFRRFGSCYCYQKPSTQTSVNEYLIEADANSWGERERLRKRESAVCVCVCVCVCACVCVTKKFTMFTLSKMFDLCQAVPIQDSQITTLQSAWSSSTFMSRIISRLDNVDLLFRVKDNMPLILMLLFVVDLNLLQWIIVSVIVSFLVVVVHDGSQKVTITRAQVSQLEDFLC